MVSGRSNFLLGMLLGGIAGAAAALLLAPQSGVETRQRMKQKASQTRDRASDMVGSVKESAEKATGSGWEFIETKKAQIRQAIEAGREAAARKRAELEAEAKEGEPKANI